MSYIIKNEVRLLEDLEKYPPPDYDLNTHYILKGNRVVKMTEYLLKENMPRKHDHEGKQQIEYYDSIILSLNKAI